MQKKHRLYIKDINDDNKKKKSNPVKVGDLLVTRYAIGVVVEVTEHNSGSFWSGSSYDEVTYVDHDVLHMMIKYNGWQVNP
jgi:hypothetical protein